MKFSLTVDSPREADYATSMFAALQAAMTANPPPVVQFSQTSIGEVSHTALTGYPSTGIASSGPYDVKLQTAADTAEAGEQEDDTGADAGTDATTAATGTAPGKKRGRKSAEQKAAEALAKAAAEENALKPGAALQGVSAQSLAQALQACRWSLKATACRSGPHPTHRRTRSRRCGSGCRRRMRRSRPRKRLRR